MNAICKITSIILLVSIVACFLFACKAWGTEQTTIPIGLNFGEAATLIPGIETFSGSEQEDYKYQFSPVKSATLMHDGVKTEIAPDDPRLIRLLNMFAYAESNVLMHYTQGYIDEDKVKTYLSSDATMLEVQFINDPDGLHRNKITPRIVICGDTYLLFFDAEGKSVMRFWPFVSIFYDHYGINGIPSEVRFSSTDLSWGGKYWIDFLAYAGFETDSSGVNIDGQ